MEHVLQTEREALKLRLVAIAVAAVGLYLTQQQVPWLPAVVLVAVYLAYAISMREYLLPHLPFPWVVYGLIVVDVAAISLGLLIVGTISTPLFVLFPALILYYSFHLGYASSLAAATVASLGYGGVAVLMGETQWFGSFTTVQAPLFYLLAIGGGFLAEKRFQERREKESLQEAIRVERGAKALLGVARDLSAGLDTEAILRRILQSALALTGMSAGIAALQRQDGKELVARASTLGPEQLGLKSLEEATESLQEDTPAQRALLSMQPQKIEDLKAHQQSLPPWIVRSPYKAALVIPLVFQGRALGLVYLLGDRIAESGAALAPNLGELAGLSLGHAVLLGDWEAKVGHLKEEFQGLVERGERLRQAQKKGVIQVEGLRMDLVKGDVTLDGEAVSLSPTEFDLLRTLADSAGEPLTHETLLRLVWGPEYEGQANVVDVSIHRLRRRIEKDPSRPKRIITVRGVGYMMALASQKPPRKTGRASPAARKVV